MAAFSSAGCLTFPCGGEVVELRRVTVTILAAGLSRRMGGADKLLLPFRGKPLLAHTLDLAAELPFARRIVVTTAARLQAVPPPKGVDAVINPHPERGQSSSVRLGMAAAPDAQAYLFLTADQPLLDAAVVRMLVEEAAPGYITYPAVNGKPAGPALFPALLREELLALEGDAGGRTVRAAHPALCRAVEMPAPLFFDIDTPEAYRELLEGSFGSRIE